MPSGSAWWIREGFAEQDQAGVKLETSWRSSTGYKNVVEVGGKYQTRIQVKGDGVGGTTHQEAAPALAAGPLHTSTHHLRRPSTSPW